MCFYIIGCIQPGGDTINSTHGKITGRQYQIMRFGVSQRDWLLVVSVMIPSLYSELSYTMIYTLSTSQIIVLKQIISFILSSNAEYNLDSFPKKHKIFVLV